MVSKYAVVFYFKVLSSMPEEQHANLMTYRPADRGKNSGPAKYEVGLLATVIYIKS